MATASQTTVYRTQHAQLREHAAKMLAATDAATHRTLLAQLAGYVKMHLKVEDDSLYPRLLAHADPAVRASAQRLQESMGGLAAAFTAFYEKWVRRDAIAADPNAYVAEMRGVLDALSRRMDMEDRDLYDLADRALAAA